MVHRHGRRGPGDIYGAGRLVGSAEPFEMPSYAPQEWTRDAACRLAADPEDWFQQPNSLRTVKALTVCSSCPVKQVCFDYAISKRINYGIWGGRTEKQLRYRLLEIYKTAKAKSFVVIRNGARKRPAS